MSRVICDPCKIERKGVQEGSETSDAVKDIEILFGSDEDGQDQEQAHQRNSKGQTI